MTEQLVSGINEDQRTGINLHDIEVLQRIDVREGLTLRPMRVEDASRLLEILESDPSIRERVTVASRIHTEEDVVREVDFMESEPGLIRYVIADDAGLCVGLVSFWLDPGFFGQEPLPNTYGFGYFLDPAQRGKSIVTDSVKNLIKIASESVPGIEGFTAFCEDGNAESVSVLTSLGFVPTGITYSEPVNGWEERQYLRGLSENE